MQGRRPSSFLLRQTAVLAASLAFGGTSAFAATDLSKVCPSPFVIQMDWYPQAEHGPEYQLLGDDYKVDAKNKKVRGSLVSQGQPTGIEVEVRSGGPAIGNMPVPSVMYTDDSIHAGMVSTDIAISLYSATPVKTIMAVWEKSPILFMWDPATYPDVHTIADLGKNNIIVNISPWAKYSSWLIASGLMRKDLVDKSYDGSPTQFIAADGKYAQQGTATNEPYLYEHEFKAWKKPIQFQLLHDAGYKPYFAAVSVKPSALDALSPCLKQLIPVWQQAIVDYLASPDRANHIIVDTVSQFRDFWTYSEQRAKVAHEAILKYGLMSNGSNKTIGDMDPPRIQELIDNMRLGGEKIPDGLVADKLLTNQFIDPAIGLPQ